MRKIGKILQIALIALLVLSMAACGGAPASSSAPASSDAPAAASSEAPAAPEASAEKVMLSLAFNMDIQEAFSEFLDKFQEKYPNVEIDLVAMPPAFEEYLQTRVSSRNLPDVFSISGNAYGVELADNDLLMDLTDSVAGQRLIEGVKPAFTSKEKGKLFGITYGLSTTLMYYNKAMFEEAGITEVPKDWNSYVEACEKLKQANKKAVSLTLGDGTIGNTSFSYGFANNVVQKDPDWKAKVSSGEMNFDTPEIQDIFAKVKFLIDNGYAQDGAISTQYQQGIDNFVQEQTAMYFGGIWCNGGIGEAAKFEYDVFIPPLNDDPAVQTVVVGTETGWGVSQLTEHPEVCLNLMDFFTGEGYLILQNKRGSVPALKDTTGTVTAPQIAAVLPSILEATNTAQLYFEYLPSQIQDQLPKMYQEVISGTATPEQAAKQFNDIFKDSF